MAAAQGPRVLIIGGGIGGLTAGIAMRQAGIDAIVFERSVDIRQAQIGTAFVLWHNGMRMLKSIGVVEKVHAVGSPPLQWFETRTYQGKIVWRWRVSALTERIGSPYPVGIRRAKLHEVLVGAIDEDALRLGAECTGFEQDNNGVTARFADGREERGDILVDAEGIRSAVRDQLLGPSELRYSGITLWHSIVESDHEIVRNGFFRELAAPGFRFKSFPVGEHEAYWSCIAKAPKGGKDPEEGAKHRLLELTKGFAEPTQALIEASPGIYRTDIMGRKPTKIWGNGRVTILGDAVHPTTPMLGQGASQAMEDGIVLAQCLSGSSDLVASLRSYEARRMPRAIKVMTQSWRIGQMSMFENPWFTMSITAQRGLGPLIVKGYQKTISLDVSKPPTA